MPNPSDLAYTNNMSSGKQPFLTDLDESLTSIQTYVNARKDDLEQLRKDAYGSSYTFDQDAAAQYTHNLYDKKTVVDSYTGGDFTISTTGAWTDLDATNAAIVFTPELAGDFRVSFSFSVSAVSTNATNEIAVRFRLTDGSTASTQLPRVHLVTGATGTTNVTPILLSYTYDSVAASSTTVKLQYFITTQTAMTLKVLANSNDPILMEAEKV